jgi:hypothetical protein
MAWNPFLDNDYGAHWSEWGPDMQSTGVTHGGGDQVPWEQEQPSPWTNPDTGQIQPGQAYPTGGAGATIGNVPEEYKQYAEEAGAAMGIDPKMLLALAATESNFNPAAVSPAGAMGLMQFMPGTAKQYGIDPMDPRQAMFGAAQYLRDLNAMKGIDGDWSKTLAAYNAGPKRVLDGSWQRIPETIGHNQKTWANYQALAGGGEQGQQQVSGDMPSVQGFSVDGYYRQGDRNSQGLYGPETNYSHNTRLPTNLPMARGQNPYPWMRDLNGGNEDLKNLSPDFAQATQRLAALQGQPVAFYGGYRNDVENRERGGKSGSFHRYGKAGDIQKPSGISDVDYARMLRNSGFTGAGYYGGQRWHADTRETSGNKTTWGNWPAQAREVFLGKQASLMQQQPPALQQAAGLPIDPIDPYRQMIMQNLGMV